MKLALIRNSVLALIFCALSSLAADKAPSEKKETTRRQPDPNAPEPELMTYQRGDATLHGWIYKPEGKGPFPAMLYNHGSDKVPGWFPTLGAYWTAKGYVFFVPHRAGHGRSPGDWIVDLQNQFREKEKDPKVSQKNDIALHERANLDVEAAVTWLKKQPYIDASTIVMGGISYGGIQTVLASEKDLGVKAFVTFSPAAMSWAGNPQLRVRLLEAVKNAKAPMFLLQANNDYNLGPTELLGKELNQKGKPNQSKLYPAFGDPNNPADGHGGFAVRGADVWGADVMAFLNRVLKKPDTTSTR